jgi:hypothetical protein
MDTAIEAKKRWKLIPLNPRVLAGVSLHASFTTFVLSDGCAEYTSDEMSLFRSPQISTLGVEVGRDVATVFVVRTDSECIESVDSQHELPPRFMNSSYAALLIFVSLYDGTLKAMQQDQSVMDAIACVAALKKSFFEFDERALQQKQNYWSVLIENLSNGLM